MKHGFGQPLVAFGLIAFLLGCTHAKAPVLRAPPAQNVDDAAKSAALAAEVQSLVERASQLRGIPWKGPVRVSVLRDAEFDARRAASLREDLSRSPDWPLEPPPTDKSEGFYDPNQRMIVLRQSIQKWRADARRAALLHELTHALQDAQFGFASMKAQDADSYVALHALWEGDASLVEFLDVAMQANEPIDRQLLLHQWALETRSERFKARSGTWAQAPYDFPYVAGEAFVTRLYRAGGFVAVDLAYKTPPLSVAEILDPDRYAAGQPPERIVPPTASGDEAAAKGPLFVRLALSEIAPRVDATALTRDLVGDLFVRHSDHPDRPAYDAWRTDWSTAESAAQFERALAQSGSIGVFVGRREGTVVGIHGPIASEAMFDEAFAAPAQSQKRPPPLGRFKLPQEPRVPVEDPTLTGRQYLNSFWGVSVGLPEGTNGQSTPGWFPSTFMFGPAKPGGLTGGGALFMPRTVSPEQVRQIEEGMVKVAAPSFTGAPTDGPARWPGSRFAQWTGGGEPRGSARLTAWFVPLCSGRGEALLFLTEPATAPPSDTERWLSAVDLSRQADSPACKWLAWESAQELIQHARAVAGAH